MVYTYKYNYYKYYQILVIFEFLFWYISRTTYTTQITKVYSKNSKENLYVATIGDI